MNVERYIKKLGNITNKLVSECKYEAALTSAKVLATIYYEYNQIYTDFQLEENLIKIRNQILSQEQYAPDAHCVMFYDGFGLDLRGWAASYVRALSKLGYYVVYVCPSKSMGKIPHIVSELRESHSKIVYLDSAWGNVEKAVRINSLFKAYKPTAAFFYTLPTDVSAAVAFSNNASTTRFQIDLTDHAFWIGVNAFDFILESREMGASIAVHERRIYPGKIRRLDGVPYINTDKYDGAQPFDIHKEKYIFTGGALYKTLGDEGLLYYKTAAYILDNFPDIKFLYAGSGDDSEMQKLITKYKGRVFFIPERPDFFEIIRNCVLYLNSYPMFGGLMMRYAALARKVPITLRHDNDADGILMNQSELGIEFDDYQDYIAEIYKLLNDDEYRKTKENLVEQSVLTEDRFAYNLKLLIEEQKTEFAFDEIHPFDTTEFRKEYKRRYTKEMLYKAFAKKSNIRILKYAPNAFMLGCLIKFEEKLHK